MKHPLTILIALLAPLAIHALQVAGPLNRNGSFDDESPTT